MRNLRRPEFAKEWVTAGLRADSAPAARSQFVLECYPDLAERTVDMGDVVYRPFNLDPTERFCIAGLVQGRSPQRIFEFGTYDGATTVLLARAAPQAEIVTLDLPDEAVKALDPIVEQQLAVAGGVGARFRGSPEADRITQVLDDSRTFDASPYARRMDLVLVDGGHSYDCVRADSANALRMLAPGGLIVWDDYSDTWPDVRRAVDELAAGHGLRVVHLVPTELAVYDAAR